MAIRFVKKSNHPKTPLRRTLLVAALMGLVLSLALLVYIVIPKNSVPRSTAPIAKKITAVSKQVQVAPGLPVRLKIPSINVDSAVSYVGLSPAGVMDTPTSKEDVGWYKLGQRPGENGNAVITGHYGWKNNEAAAFDSLNKLQKGDQLSVVDDKSAIITFVVRESRSYDPKADASDIFISKDGKSHLNLITCEGVWSNAKKSYSQRLVVFTDKI
ncbi:MAG: class F sortase [Microcoleus sp.]